MCLIWGQKLQARFRIFLGKKTWIKSSQMSCYIKKDPRQTKDFQTFSRCEKLKANLWFYKYLLEELFPNTLFNNDICQWYDE